MTTKWEKITDTELARVWATLRAKGRVLQILAPIPARHDSVP